jgi:phosphomannomutase
MSRLPELLARESSDILEIDGIKAIIDENSWVLVRPSNTEHAIRISVESTRQKARPLYDRISKEILGICENLR